jgi:hypothetical protein
MDCTLLKDLSRNSYGWKVKVRFARIWELRNTDQGILFSLDYVVADQQVRSICTAFLSTRLFRSNVSVNVFVCPLSHHVPFFVVPQAMCAYLPFFFSHFLIHMFGARD